MEAFIILIAIVFFWYCLFGGKKKKQRKKAENLAHSIRDAENYSKSLQRDIDERSKKLNRISADLVRAEDKLRKYKELLSPYEDTLDIEKRKAAAEKDFSAMQKKLEKSENDFRSSLHASQVFDSYQYAGEKLLLDGFDPNAFSPMSSEDLMCMQIKELRALFRENQKQITKLVESYQGRYNTKALATIYHLMVLALEAEMQNILHKLNYGKLETAIASVKELTARYYTIATSGNQTISSTLTKFIGQLEYYYIEAVKIEYEYYVKRERAREEQRAIKEQMRQEAEERKQLEAQRKKMEAEEAKYEKEMERISVLIASSAETEEVAKLRAQLEKVQAQLSEAQTKKEKIVTLQNGKAGTVYVISNIGAFGENVFKIGMTRRDEPMDRVRELGDASVPFPFDVHSFIFSNDAVDLETKLHRILNNDRVNRVNLRKEFFRVDIDRLQALVEELDPSAAFNRTALAEQFRQSLSISEVPETAAPDLDE